MPLQTLPQNGLNYPNQRGTEAAVLVPLLSVRVPSSVWRQHPSVCSLTEKASLIEDGHLWTVAKDRHTVDSGQRQTPVNSGQNRTPVNNSQIHCGT